MQTAGRVRKEVRIIALHPIVRVGKGGEHVNKFVLYQPHVQTGRHGVEERRSLMVLQRVLKV